MDEKPQNPKQENEPRKTDSDRRTFLLLIPAAISAFIDLSAYSSRPPFGWIGLVVFLLSPLFVLYTIIVATYFAGGRNGFGTFWAVLLLLPQAMACCILIWWMTHGIPLET